MPILECLTKTSNVSKIFACSPNNCDPDDGCWPRDCDTCGPETDTCGPDYGGDCIPDCSPADGSDDCSPYE